MQTLNSRSDADDFYVFLFDEEDTSTFKQATLKQKKSGKGFKLESKRVFGFWCFNAGVGFRKI